MSSSRRFKVFPTRGIVVDVVTGLPIAGALVIVQVLRHLSPASQGQGRTGEDGRYEFDVVEEPITTSEKFVTVCHVRGYQRWGTSGNSVPERVELVPNNGTNCGRLEVKCEFRDRVQLKFIDFWEIHSSTRPSNVPYELNKVFLDVFRPQGLIFEDLIPGYYEILDPNEGEYNRRFPLALTIAAGTTTHATFVPQKYEVNRDINYQAVCSDEHVARHLGEGTRLHIWDSNGNGNYLDLNVNRASLLRRACNKVTEIQIRNDDKVTDSTLMTAPIHVCTANSLSFLEVEFCLSPKQNIPSHVPILPGRKSSLHESTKCLQRTTHVSLQVVRAIDGSPVPLARVLEIEGNSRFKAAHLMASHNGKVSLPLDGTRYHYFDVLEPHLIISDPPDGGLTVCKYPYGDVIALEPAASIQGSVTDFQDGPQVKIHVGYNSFPPLVVGKYLDRLAASPVRPDGTFRITSVLTKTPGIAFAVRDGVYIGKPVHFWLTPGEKLVINLASPTIGLATYTDTAKAFVKARVFPFVAAGEETLVLLSTRQALLAGNDLPEGWEDDLLPSGFLSAVPHVGEARYADCNGRIRLDGFPAGRALVVDERGNSSVVHIPALTREDERTHYYPARDFRTPQRTEGSLRHGTRRRRTYRL